MTSIQPDNRLNADRPNTGRSFQSDTTWRYSVFGPERLGRGAVLFTGPDGIRDHRVRVDREHRYVGEGTMSGEGTSEVAYLWRAPRNMPHPRPKSSCVGEVGWGIPQFVDWKTPQSGMQICLGEFRQAVEDRHTHLLLNPHDPNWTGDAPTRNLGPFEPNYMEKPMSPYGLSSGRQTADTGYVSTRHAYTRRRLSTASTATTQSLYSNPGYHSYSGPKRYWSGRR